MVFPRKAGNAIPNDGYRIVTKHRICSREHDADVRDTAGETQAVHTEQFQGLLQFCAVKPRIRLFPDHDVLLRWFELFHDLCPFRAFHRVRRPSEFSELLIIGLMGIAHVKNGSAFRTGAVDLTTNVLDDVPRFGNFERGAWKHEIIQHVYDEQGFFFHEDHLPLFRNPSVTR